MPKVAVYSSNGEQVGDMELSDKVFGEEINEPVIYEVAVSQMANVRKGTASVKNRAKVSGGGRKPWRQKGTGRARAGTNRSPLWRGGGVIFGPSPRDYRYKLPQKVRNLAFRSALSAKVAEDDLVVVEELNFEEPKTKKMVEILNSLNAENNTLVVLEKDNENAKRSARNIAEVVPVNVENLRVLDLVNYKKLLLTKEAVSYLEEVLG